LTPSIDNASAELLNGAPASAEPVERTSDVLVLPKTSHTDFIERTWRFWCSTKLMVVLMALFALGMAAGTFLNPKEDALAEIERVFANRPWVLWSYRTFELYAPFKSWWFTSIILALALNNLASSIERLPRIFLIVRNPERKLTDAVLRGLPNRRTVPRGELSADGIQQQFESAGYAVTRTVENGVTYLFGERGAWTRFGVWVVHLALLLVCFGGIIGRLFAFEGTMDIPADGGRASFFLERMPDGTIIRHPLPFTIQCNQFHLDKFKDGSARRFASDLTVLDLDGKEVLSKKIIVNDPLDYGGMKFYQATYSERPDNVRVGMSITDLKSGQAKDVLANPRQSFSVGDGHTRYTVVNYEENYGELGPAVQLVREEDVPGKTEPAVTSFWVFSKYPDFDAKFRGDAFGLKFDKLQPAYSTGLQIARDPGVPYMYVGFFLLWSGLFIAFWAVHRRLWARVEEDKVVFAGAAHRNKEQFREEFGRFLSRFGIPTPGVKPT
jgi:cytochrome c biogenesis protein